jgi:hypothetical protein
MEQINQLAVLNTLTNKILISIYRDKKDRKTHIYRMEMRISFQFNYKFRKVQKEDKCFIHNQNAAISLVI